MIEVGSEREFDKLIAGAVPALVYFGSSWCAPCKALKPALESVGLRYGARLRMADVDVEAFPALAARFEIRALPGLVMVSKGIVLGSLVGATVDFAGRVKEDVLVRFIDGCLG